MRLVTFALGLFLLTPAAPTQTTLNLGHQARNVDFSQAPFTRPVKTGESLPATCTVGELYFHTGGTAGKNLYGCTAPDTWTLLGGDALPAQSGHGGKILRTDGSTATWTASLALPPSSVQVIDSASKAITADALNVRISPNNNYTLTSAPTIADGIDGQLLLISNNSTSFSVTLQDEANLANSNLRLGGSNATIGPRGSLLLTYNTALASWIRADAVSASGGGGGATTFLTLTDTPTSYVGAAGKAVAVKNDQTGLEFISFPSAPVSSVFGRTGAVSAQTGDYSFNQIAGTTAKSQLPATTVHTDQSNTWIAGTQDFSGASATRPVRVVSSLPPTCAAGDYVMLSSAPVGQNTYACTADNTWALQGDGIGASAITSYVALLGASCQGTTAGTSWNLPVSNAPEAACRTGTSTNQGVLLFDDTAVESAQANFTLPPDWDSASGSGLSIRWMPMAAAPSGNVVWGVQTACVAPGESTDPSWNPAQTMVSAAGSQYRPVDATISSLNVTGCAADEQLYLRVYRDGANPNDTMNGDAGLIQVRISLRRLLQ